MTDSQTRFSHWTPALTQPTHVISDLSHWKEESNKITNERDISEGGKINKQLPGDREDNACMTLVWQMLGTGRGIFGGLKNRHVQKGWPNDLSLLCMCNSSLFFSLIVIFSLRPELFWVQQLVLHWVLGLSNLQWCPRWIPVGFFCKYEQQHRKISWVQSISVKKRMHVISFLTPLWIEKQFLYFVDSRAYTVQLSGKCLSKQTWNCNPVYSVLRYMKNFFFFF